MDFRPRRRYRDIGRRHNERCGIAKRRCCYCHVQNILIFVFNFEIGKHVIFCWRYGQDYCATLRSTSRTSRHIATCHICNGHVIKFVPSRIHVNIRGRHRERCRSSSNFNCYSIVRFINHFETTIHVADGWSYRQGDSFANFGLFLVRIHFAACSATNVHFIKFIPSGSHGNIRGWHRERCRSAGDINRDGIVRGILYFETSKLVAVVWRYRQRNGFARYRSSLVRRHVSASPTRNGHIIKLVPSGSHGNIRGRHRECSRIIGDFNIDRIVRGILNFETSEFIEISESITCDWGYRQSDCFTSYRVILIRSHFATIHVRNFHDMNNRYLQGKSRIRVRGI